MIPSDDKFSSSPALRNFAQPTFANQQTNVISGPNTKPWNEGMMYWSHSVGDQTPM